MGQAAAGMAQVGGAGKRACARASMGLTIPEPMSEKRNFCTEHGKVVWKGWEGQGQRQGQEQGQGVEEGSGKAGEAGVRDLLKIL